MRHAIVFFLILTGCGQVKPNANVGSQEQFEARRLDEKQAANLASLEAKIDALTHAVNSLQKGQSAQIQDREEILAYNACKSWCDQRAPWPQLTDEARAALTEDQASAWHDSLAVKRARKAHQKCQEKCDERKPKAQPDWSC